MELPDLAFITAIARQAGALLKDGYGQQHTIGHKGRINLVTEMDRASEELIIGAIHAQFPGHTIVAEESGLRSGSLQHCWYIDPLDGTSNYAHAIPLYAVSIAYAYQGERMMAVTYDPSLDECFSAEKGKGAHLNGQSIHVSETADLVNAVLVTGFPYDLDQRANNNIDNFASLSMHAQSIRRLGSAVIDLTWVAAGRLDGYWELGMGSYDIAAGTLIIEEAGGMVTCLDGNPDYFKPPYALITANPVLLPKMRAGLKNSSPAA